MTVTITRENEPINQAMPGTSAHIIKAGPSRESGYIETSQYGSLRVAWFRYGHANMGYVRVDDDVVILAVVRRVQPETRWNGASTSDGDAYLYPPGSMHFSTASTPGSDVGMMVVDSEALTKRNARVPRWRSGHLVPRLDSRDTAELTSLLASARQHSPGRRDGSLEGDALGLAVRAASRIASPSDPGTVRLASDRRIVADVVDYLEATREWHPPMERLHDISGYSDRRIESAFEAVMGVTPGAYLRARALSAARTRLLDPVAIPATVTQVALDHGLAHLGRFSAYYQMQFGESLSESLRRASGDHARRDTQHPRALEG